MRVGIDVIGVGVGAVIIREGKVLLLKRARNPDKGSWSIPGGAVEHGETLLSAVAREVEEETGLKTRTLLPVSISDHITTSEESLHHWVSVCYLAEAVEGEPFIAEPSRHLEMEWFSLDALPSPISPPALEAILAVKKQKTSV